MRTPVNASWTRQLCQALLALGLLLTGIATWRYVAAERELQDSFAEANAARPADASTGSGATLRGLVAADVARRELLARQNDSLMLGGSGLVLVSLGWLGLNVRRYLKGRRIPSAGQMEATP